MRKLGSGHSLMFVAPPGCCRNILRSVGKFTAGAFTSIDVVKWTIHQTRDRLSRDAALWVLEGVEFARRESTIGHYIGNSAIDYESEASDPMVRRFLEEIEEPESRSLADFYNYQAPDQCFVKAELEAIKGHRFADDLQEKWSRLDANEL